MRKDSRIINAVTFVVVLVVAFNFPLTQSIKASAIQSEKGQGDTHRDDPCDQLPDPPGKAKGIDKLCPTGGSSSGIAKGDFNGDGFADLAVGVPGEDLSGLSDVGAINVIYGSADGLTTTSTTVPLPQFFSQGSAGVPGASEAGDGFGSALAAGDFNGDGFSDLAIGVPNEDITTSGFFGPVTYKDLGGVVVIYGSRNGLTATDSTKPPSRYFDLTNNSAIELHDGAHLGFSLSWGDFNGDGVGDLAMGVPGYSYSPGFLQFKSEAGAVWVLYGVKNTGLSLVGNRLFVESDLFPGYLGAAPHFGKALTAGDFNGDTFSELVIGAPDEGNDDLGFGPVQFGLLYVISGTSIGLQPDAGKMDLCQGCIGPRSSSPDVSGGRESYDHFGSAFATGDFNNDGRDDLAVGVPGEDVGSIADAGAVQVFYGTSQGLDTVGQQFFTQNALGSPSETGDQFGTALAAGDFSGDGRKDLAIGVPLEDVLVDRGGGVFENVVNAGEVDVIYGSGSGLSTTSHAPQFWHQAVPGIPGDPETSDHFGAALTAWNFGKDEGSSGQFKTSDLAIGVPLEDVSGASNAGAVNVVYGSASANGLTSTGSRFFSQDTTNVPGGAEAGDHFGAAIY